jgi:hypothetical protein
LCTIKEVDRSIDQLQQAIISSYYHSHPAKTTRSPRTIPWWNKKLSGFRAKTRRLFNKAKITGEWDPYKETLTCYNKEIRRAKQLSLRVYCQEINDVSGSARLMRIMAKQGTNKVSTVKLPNGQQTEMGERTLKELFRVHFLDSKLIRQFVRMHNEQGRLEPGLDYDQSSIRWALSTLK